jgi:aminoglycoside phosphotransferase (APT) family kinase protein
MLKRLEASLCQTSLIHGDVKPQNFLVHPGPGSDFGYKLIDWERAALGDPCWDVACAVATPLMLHAFAEGGTERTFARHELLTDAVRADMIAVLQAYRLAASPEVVQNVSEQRCAQMVVARLLAAAYELNFAIDRMTPLADALLDLANHLAAGPTESMLFSTKNSEAA